MFYKIRNILLILLSFVLTNVEAKAQGVVSLSEDALFEDELDTEIIKKDVDATNDNAEIPVINSGTANVAITNTAPAKTESVSVASQSAPSAFDNVVKKSSTENNDDKNLNYIEPVDSDLYNSLDGHIKLKADDVFEHMSDIEKRTAILNLELRREKLQDDIEAIKHRRREAIAKEKQKEEDRRLMNLEKEKEIERKLVEEQSKLRELDLKFEKLRQEKVLSAYKNKMLEETQKWIEHDGSFYKQISDLRSENKLMAENIKEKMNTIKTKAEEKRKEFVNKVADYEKRLEDNNVQIDILRTRIANLERELEKAKEDSFAGLNKEQIAAAMGIDASTLNYFDKSDGSLAMNEMSSSESEPIATDLTKLYSVTEIRGKGNELIARLINQNGTAFYVKKGTALQSGHIISKITTTFVMAEKNGDKQYLYFSAGGVLPTELSETNLSTEKKETEK